MRLSAWLFVLFISFGLTACFDGDDGDDSVTSTAASTATATATETATETETATATATIPADHVVLTGTVATGKAFQGWVTATNASGQAAHTDIYDEGAYALQIPVGAPYLLMAVGANSNSGETLFSYANTDAAASESIVNITDLTTAVLQLATGKSLDDMQNVFSAWSSQRPAQTSIDTAQQVIQNQLYPLFAQASLDPANINLFTTPFQPNGFGLDGVLDVITDVRYNDGEITLIGQNGQALMNPFGLANMPLATATTTSTTTSTATSTATNGDWTLRISGTVNSSLTGGVAIPNLVLENMLAPTADDFSAIRDTFSQVQADATGTVSNLSVTTVTDTDTHKTYNVSFTMNATQAGFAVSMDYNLTYDYTR
jgi:hypothetical protein